MQVLLNDKPMMTPGRQALDVPTEALAEAIQKEWAAGIQDVAKTGYTEKLFTSLAATALDKIPHTREAVTEQLIDICQNDQILCWVDAPKALVEMQSIQWQPLINHINEALGLELAPRYDLKIPTLPSPDRDVLQRWLEKLTDFQLIAFSHMIELTHSFLVPFCLVSGHLSDPAQAWAVAELHETHQRSQWGEDPEEMARVKAQEDEFISTLQFYRFASET